MFTKSLWLKSLALIFTLSLLASCGGGGGGGNSSPPGPIIPAPGEGEGTDLQPKDLGVAPISYAGAVGAYGNSYYMFKTGTSPVSYTISLSNIQSDLGWELYSGQDFSNVSIVWNCDDYGSGIDESCDTPYKLNADKYYYLKVNNAPNSTSSTYDLTIIVTPPPSAPTISVTAGHLQNIISWSPVSGVTSYNLYWSTSSPVTKTSYTQKITFATSPYIHAGVTQGVPYYYVVTAINNNGESAESGEKSATPSGALTSLSTNFDDGTLQGWTASGTWGLTNTTYQSSPYSVTDSPSGNYADYANMSLTSPVIDLSSSATPMLSFYHRYDIESPAYPYDHGYVQVSMDGGVTFTTVADYSGLLSSWTGSITIDLTSYKSDKVVIRFKFWSDFSNTAPHDGWYIDDIVIQ